MFWFDGKWDLPSQVYDDVSVASVGAGASVAFVVTASVVAVESAVGSEVGLAVTVTVAGGAAEEVGRRGATPCGSRGGSWEGSTLGRGGNGARPGKLRGGSGARGGTAGDRRRGQKNKTDV